MAKEAFNRYEFKYLLDYVKYKQMVNELQKYTILDEHADQYGYYKIRSLYYDTANNEFYQATINNEYFRQKLRLRTYHSVTINDYAFLEIKQKCRGVVNKRRTRIKLKHAYQFLKHNTGLSAGLDYDVSNRQILGEVSFIKRFYNLSPKVILTYDRQAFQGIDEPDVRVTFDKNLKKHEFNFRLEDSDEGEYFMDPDMYVLEAKVNNRMPLWLARILSDFECYKQSFSKYTYSYGRTLKSSDKSKIIV